MSKNQSIKCDAEKCHFHTDDDFCGADSIKVGSPCSCCSDDTTCCTFIPKKDV